MIQFYIYAVNPFYHMTIMLFSEIAHVINNVMTTRELTPAQFPIGYHNRITICIITLVNSNQNGVHNEFWQRW